MWRDKWVSTLPRSRPGHTKRPNSCSLTLIHQGQDCVWGNLRILHISFNYLMWLMRSSTRSIVFSCSVFSISLVVISYISSSLTLKAKREINFYVFQNKLETLNYYPIDTCRKQMCNWSVCVAIISFQGQGKVFRVFPRHKPRHKFPTYCKSDWTLLMVYTLLSGGLLKGPPIE